MSALRADLQVVASLIPEGASVLDIGCGDGELLHWLKNNRRVKGRGMELSIQGVNTAIARGVSVIQGDADVDLQHYPDAAYDYVVLSQTLQTLRAPKDVLTELVRIGRHAIVSVPNFGHWKNRLYLLLNGKMPVTKNLSYTWYETPNIHFCTLSDFVELCDTLSLVIEKRISVNKHGVQTAFTGKAGMANVLGEQGVFVIRGRN